MINAVDLDVERIANVIQMQFAVYLLARDAEPARTDGADVQQQSL
jgi:hypothetical protein